ncbi:spore coat protein YutH [Virgibacillus halotolerans]|uniref:hypothetical protein n=1 Tax=Virgibacillus halotolerans TaxID=1071053 RepID=UPI00195F7EFC|nr:hypothetical protein [Virgibacillus halotolerans]MBM7600686.1 spore coat protein YutH [Virgibacillus halotolerans]
MPFRELLHTYYELPVEEKIVLDGKEGYKHDEYFYFIINVNNKEVIHMEQAALAYYLLENHFNHTAFPIQNRYGEWFTTDQGKNHMVLQVQQPLQDQRLSPGESLASFHLVGANYDYEPKAISSYGQWKALWIEKLTVFETNLEQEAKKHPTHYYQLIMDILPYVIGISENAIQYLQESEQDNRFHEADQGTISFRRYTNQLEKPILWVDEFVYDHPARDLAEYIRMTLLKDGGEDELVEFLKDYNSIRPLSVFSWRLLYARLIFPIHFFDIMQSGFLTDDFASLYTQMTDLLDKQADYERKLADFFQMGGVKHEKLNIPVIKWL